MLKRKINQRQRRVKASGKPPTVLDLEKHLIKNKRSITTTHIVIKYKTENRTPPL